MPDTFDFDGDYKPYYKYKLGKIDWNEEFKKTNKEKYMTKETAKEPKKIAKKVKACVHCGVEHEEGNYYNVNKQAVCAGCLGRLYTRCNECSSYVLKDSVIIAGNNRVVCSECIKRYYKCGGCRKHFKENEQTGLDGKDYCPSCFERRYASCCHCRTVINRQDVAAVRGETWCKTCADATFFTCDQCGRLARRGQEFQFEGDDAHYCENCYNARNQNGGVAEYHHTGFRRNYFAKGENDPRSIPQGVEIELDNPEGSRTDRSTIAKYANTKVPFAPDVKTDGSLSGNGFEIAWQPATLRAWYEKNEQMEAFFAACQKHGYRGHNLGAVHIHVDKRRISNFTLAKVFKFFYNPENFVFILVVSQRRKDALSRWANLNGLNDKTLYKQARNKESYIDRYTGINITQRTVEFRIYNSTVDLKRFYKNLEFTESIIRFCSIFGYKDITKDNYLKYIAENRKSYINLYDFLVERAMIVAKTKPRKDTGVAPAKPKNK